MGYKNFNNCSFHTIDEVKRILRDYKGVFGSVEEVWGKYTAGGEFGWWCFIMEKFCFYGWDIVENNWKPVSGFDATSIWDEIDKKADKTIDFIKVHAPDADTIIVKLSDTPQNEVTEANFYVYDARTGDNVAVNEITGSGVDYTLKVDKSNGVGITFTEV